MAANSLSRRSVISSAVAIGAAVALPAVAIAATSPDAELFALCKRWHKALANAVADSTDKSWDDLSAITEQIVAIPAQTHAGYEAKAAATCACHPDSWDWRALVDSLLDDMNIKRAPVAESMRDLLPKYREVRELVLDFEAGDTDIGLNGDGIYIVNVNGLGRVPMSLFDRYHACDKHRLAEFLKVSGRSRS